jgi:hypothetical protein
MPKKKPPPAKKGPLKARPEELARNAIAHEEAVGPDKVRLNLQVVLARGLAETLAAEAIRRETNFATYVTEILEVAASKLRA